jgi:hypothetical protein
VDEVQETGIPWLTDPQRDFLAHLSVITIQPQLKPRAPTSVSPTPWGSWPGKAMSNSAPTTTTSMC